jgi:hypothetical protein
MSKLSTVSELLNIDHAQCHAIVCCIFGCHVLASTFKVLTWHIMPDAGEDKDGGPEIHVAMPRMCPQQCPCGWSFYHVPLRYSLPL